MSPPRPHALRRALLSAGIVLSVPAVAADAPSGPAQDWLNQWAQVWVYAVTPYCQVLANGLRICQPVGLVGPAPASPAAAYQPLVPVPLAPPSVQMPTPMPYALPPLTINPYLPQGLPPQTTPPMPPWAQPTSPAQAAPAQTAAVSPTPALAVPVPQTAPTEHKAMDTTPEPAREQSPQGAPPPSDTGASSAAATPKPETAQPTGPAPATTHVEGGTAAKPLEAVAYFEFDSARLTAAGRAALDTWLAQDKGDRPILVTGHADRLGPVAYNLDLSRRRAEAVRDYLVAKGLDARRIRIVAKGEREPVVHCKGGARPALIACLAPNRRVRVDP